MRREPWGLLLFVVLLIAVVAWHSRADAGMMGVGQLMGAKKLGPPAPPPEGSGFDPAAFPDAAFDLNSFFKSGP